MKIETRIQKENMMKLTNDMIDRMQHNTRSMAALRLPPPDGQHDLAHVLDKTDIGDLVMLTNNAEWIPAILDKRLNSATYRLKWDYEPDRMFLPCPNCGCENPTHYSYYAEGNEVWQRQCNHCQLAMESGLDQEDADRKWNEMARRLAI